MDENIGFVEYRHDTNDELLVVGRKNALSADEMLTIQQLEHETGAVNQDRTKLNMRHRELVYTHVVTRIEIPLRAQNPGLYHKILQMMRIADNRYWSELTQPVWENVMPEIEFIVYDTALTKEPPGIEPHVDNGSVVTLIIMLSDPSNFNGGTNYFEPKRELRLEQGQAVIFRGEKCEHWISPVLEGRRAILQVELQKGVVYVSITCTVHTPLTFILNRVCLVQAAECTSTVLCRIQSFARVSS
jgi:hypothetical protein